MAVLKQLLAFAVAALVANPICCCTADMLFERPVESGSVPACCAATPPATPRPAAPPDDDSSCPCDKDPTVLVEAKVAHFDSLPGCVAAPPSRAELRTAVPHCTAGPLFPAATDLPPPPRPWRLYCRYLL